MKIVDPAQYLPKVGELYRMKETHELASPGWGKLREVMEGDIVMVWEEAEEVVWSPPYTTSPTRMIDGYWMIRGLKLLSARGKIEDMSGMSMDHWITGFEKI